MQNQNLKLINACKSGSQKAQIQLYDSYCDAMFNVAFRYLQNTEDAKDAMQEGFLKAFLNIKKYKETSAFGAWLKRIIINQCIDVIRKNRLDTETLETENLRIVDDNNWQFETSITKAQIELAIKTLPEKYRLVITLYLIEGYDNEEISEILDINTKTSRTRLRRAKLQLQEQLKTRYNEARY